MRCGTKMFKVEYEQNNHLYTKELPARSPIKARKIIRNKTGNNAKILTCTLADIRK